MNNTRRVAANEPFRLGVPLPRGAVREAGGLRLLDGGGQAVALQARPLMRWPDGSLKWALLDWLGGGQEFHLECSSDRAEAAEVTVERPVRVERRQDGVVVQAPGGAVALRVGGRLHEVIDWQVEPEDGCPLVPIIEQVDVVDQGPLRASVRLSGGFGAESPLRWIAEGHFFANQNLQRWTLTLRNTQRAQHPGGIWELGDAGSVLLRRSTVRVKPGQPCDQVACSVDREAAWQRGQSLGLHQASSGGERWNSTNHVDRDGQVRLLFPGYRLELDGNTTPGRRADPVVTLQAEGQPVLSLYAERFWQNFPKRFRATTTAVELDLFPEDGTLHELQGGEQKTHIVWIGEELAAAPEAMEQLRTKIRPRVSADWFARSRCVPFATPLSDSEDSDYCALVRQSVDGPSSFFAKREQIDEYGWRHFGDAYGDHEAAFAPPDPPLISHWNNQYDLIFGLGVRYLRGGDERWFELMEDMAWHVLDIDLYHTDEDKAAYNHGLFWHTVHYIDAGRSSHRSYPRGTVGGGPYSEHAYARGFLLYYCLTGESAPRDAVEELGQWVLNLEDGSRTPFRWLSSAKTGMSSASGGRTYHGPGRAPGNATETLLTAFELTGRREFLERVEELMHRVVHPQEDLKQLNLLDAERRWFYTLYLQALGRYLEIKIDLDELDASYCFGRETLLHYARWMARHEYPYLEKPEILEYPTETWAAQDMRKCEVFHFASRHALGAERQTFRERAEFFYRYSVKTLAAMPTRHYCRPLALLLGSGFSYEGFRGSLDPAPLPGVHPNSWPPKAVFIPQRQQAIRRAKLAVVASLLLLLSLASVAAASLLSR